MEYKNIIFEKKKQIGWIKLNRPKKLNALNREVFEELDLIITDVQEDNNIKVVVLTGNEKAFAAGADIEHMVNGGISEALKLTDISIVAQEKLSDLSKPTIAAISGYALGGGLELALCCDFRIAAENARFGFPEISLGVIPGGGGTQRLARLINQSIATKMIFLGEIIDCDKALKIGLIEKIVKENELNNEVEKLAINLSNMPVLAIRAAKKAIKNGLNVSLKDGLIIEQNLFCMLFGTEDQKEGMNAFLEKRKAIFCGR